MVHLLDMINAEVQKTGSENALSTIRKFSRRVQGTGLIKTVRANRYYARPGSKTVKKKRALKLIKRREEFRQAVKEGKVVEAPKRGGYNREQNSTSSSNSQSSTSQNTQSITSSTAK
jgi:ribosomal protein S21